MQRALCAVALLALACLLLRSARVGLAGDYVDPIGKITAQDEALYANSAIRMARQGHWLTPMFMGRLALYKPPLLMWAAGLSARILGVSRLALRLPVALVASLGLGLVFLWVAELRSWQAGACAALLVASNHLWHVLGGMCMTDGLLVAFYIAAMYCLFSDPWLESNSALWGFAAAVAAAILTKSVAGLLPLGALGLYWLAAPRKERPTFVRMCVAAGLSLALAAPWFVYQATVHGRWFFAEHIGVEILAFGAGAPPQTSRENQALFYLMRTPGIDPVLTAIALVALPGFLGELRKRSSPAVLLACWMAMVAAAVLSFQYRNISYVLPAVPALAILATAYGPYASGRRAVWMLVFAGVAFMGKVAYPSAPWGLSFHRGTIQAVAPLVSDYCERARPHELILVGMDDDLYASTLPLPKLRYCLVGASMTGGRYGMPFEYMGIVLTAAQFDDVARWTPVFREHLSEWGIDTEEPIGTLITPASPEELALVIHAHPDSDFLIPVRYRKAVEEAAQASHEIVEAPEHFFLLSRQGAARAAPPAWSCKL
ncbi:MAG TPA: glycosyltransferase family 39 protein [Bryobacteraceae bacterium]|nr:glycosyltransferase family 39 protein [Bryobacteraceae bacterium]